MDWKQTESELRAFFGDDGLKACADPATIAANKSVSAEVKSLVDSMFAEERSIWEVKEASYRLIGERVRGHIFLNTPFYFEFGLNGGWGSEKNSPGRVIAKTALERKSLFEKVPPTVYDALRKEGYFLCCGPYYDAIHHSPPQSNILKRGFRGWYEETIAALEKATDPEVRGFLSAAAAGLEAVHKIQLHFAEDAEKLLAVTSDPGRRRYLAMIAEHARRAPWEPPATFYEGLNSLGFCREIFGVVDGLAANNLGWPDRMLIDLYEADLAAGRITPAEARELIDLFLLLGDARNSHDLPCDGPIAHEIEISLTLGGCDREGKTVYNDLTKMFLASYRERGFIFPKPHCRFGSDSPDEYLLAVTNHIAAGGGIYSLVCDDGVIPALTATGHSLEDAREYNCAGCWDIVVESREDNSNGNYYYMDKVLDMMIHDPLGASATTGMVFLAPDPAESFEELYTIVLDNLRQVLRYVCAVQGINGAATWPKTWPTPLYSACLTGCLESGRDYSQGGCRYNPRAMSFLSFGTVVDSLLAMRYGCFGEEKFCTLAELLAAVRANWQGAEELRRRILALPHWGDNREESDAMARRVFDDLAAVLKPLVNERGGKFYPGVWSYREFFHNGLKRRATPDGRFAGDPLSQSLNPSHFRNREAPTTMLQALSSLELRRIAGNTVINMMMEKANFTPEVQLGLLRSAAALHLQLLQLNCADSRELLDAQKHPERYPNLIIRVCGFSAKFTSLSTALQNEVIRRRSF